MSEQYHVTQTVTFCFHKGAKIFIEPGIIFENDGPRKILFHNLLIRSDMTKGACKFAISKWSICRIFPFPFNLVLRPFGKAAAAIDTN